MNETNANQLLVEIIRSAQAELPEIAKQALHYDRMLYGNLLLCAVIAFTLLLVWHVIAWAKRNEGDWDAAIIVSGFLMLIVATVGICTAVTLFKIATVPKLYLVDRFLP